MEKGRWKVHVCLIGIVLAAVLIGIIYYNYSENQKEPGGVLVKTEQGVDYGC